MIKKSSVIKAYAQDLLPLAITEGILERVKNEFDYLKELLTSIPRLKDFLNNPSIAKEAKKGIIYELFSNNLSPVTMNHLSLIIDEERHGMLLDIIDEFFKLARKAEKVVIYVTTSIPLPEETARVLSDELSSATGRETDLKMSVDESILGGIIVRVGDRIIDGSLSGRLQRIGDSLKKRI